MRIDPTIVIDQAAFNNMKTALDSAINREAAGLDDMMLKKMLLTYYRGIYLSDTKILIELGENDIEDYDEYIEDASGDKGAELEPTEETKPFKIINGDTDEGIGTDGKIYLKTTGMVKILYNDEPLVYYNSEVLSKLYQKEYLEALENNEEYANSVLEYLENCYTYSDTGIQKYAITEDKYTETWKYGNLENSIRLKREISSTVNLINIEYYEKVSQYATPVEFMTNMMEITGSKEFINAFIEIMDQTNFITMELAEISYTKEETFINERNRNTTISGELEDDDTDIIQNWQNESESESIPTEIEKTDTSKVIHTTVKRSKETKWDLAIVEVKNWYCHIKQNNNKKTTTEYFSKTENGEEVIITNENSAIKIPQQDEYNEYTADENLDIFMDDDNYKDYSTNLDFMFHGRFDPIRKCLNIQYNHIIRKPADNYSYSDYEFTKMVVDDKEVNNSTINKIVTKTLNTGTQRITDNTDIFLALLSNEDGKIKPDAKFKSKANGGKVVRYNDLYKGTVGAGELLENGAEMMFQLLEQYKSTQGLVDIMRYIMYRYSGQDYGVTEFNFSAFDLNQIASGSTVIGKNTEEKIWCSLRNMGFSEYAVAGIMGNIYVDSGFNTQKETNTTAEGKRYGLCQWNGDRLNQLYKYVEAKGKEVNDENAQIEFLIGELTQGGGCSRLCNIPIKKHII